MADYGEMDAGTGGSDDDIGSPEDDDIGGGAGAKSGGCMTSRTAGQRTALPLLLLILGLSVVICATRYVPRFTRALHSRYQQHPKRACHDVASAKSEAPGLSCISTAGSRRASLAMPGHSLRSSHKQPLHAINSVLLSCHS